MSIQHYYLITLACLSVIFSITWMDFPTTKNEEEKAIITLIERESKAFWDKNFEAYADCWAHEDYVRTMGWWAVGGITVIQGWEARGNRTRKFMD